MCLSEKYLYFTRTNSSDIPIGTLIYDSDLCYDFPSSVCADVALLRWNVIVCASEFIILCGWTMTNFFLREKVALKRSILGSAHEYNVCNRLAHTHLHTFSHTNIYIICIRNPYFMVYSGTHIRMWKNGTINGEKSIY